MAQQLTETVETLREVDAMLVGAHAVSLQEELLPELRLAKVRLTIVDASLRLTALLEALRPGAEEERKSA